jgi:hypothetical protein
MKKYIPLLIPALLAVVVVQSVLLSRSRTENWLLHDAGQQAEQSHSELEQTLEAARQQQAEAEVLRGEVARLRADAQVDRQALERARAAQASALAPPASVPAGSAQSAAPLADRNRALLEYIGDPVEPPANMDVRYTKEGLISAVQLAANNAGVSLQGLEVEDSEYPFLVGVFCEPKDYAKLVDEIKKLDGYGYSGSVGGSDTYHSLNITPAGTYPGAAAEQISRRVMLRQQAFYQKLSPPK